MGKGKPSQKSFGQQVYQKHKMAKTKAQAKKDMKGLRAQGYKARMWPYMDGATKVYYVFKRKK